MTFKLFLEVYYSKLFKLIQKCTFPRVHCPWNKTAISVRIIALFVNDFIVLTLWDPRKSNNIKISEVIFRLIWGLLFYTNSSISQEVNNLEELYFHLKEQVSSSKKFIYNFFCMSARYRRLSRNSAVLQFLIILENSFISLVMEI